MPLKIEPGIAIERIDEFLDQIDQLLEIRYDEGEEKKRSISTKLDNFAEVAFTDGEKKKNALYPSVTVVTTGKDSRQEKQEDYEKSLKRKKRHLEAWKQQINLEEEIDPTDNSEGGRYNEIVEAISGVRDELPIYADDLERSLEELKAGHYLASSMITGRVIDYTIDQVKSSQHLGGPEEVLDHLLEDGIVDSRESKITESIKSYRDVYTHEVGKTPDSTETIILLMGCAKLLHNIQNAGKTREYELV